MVKEYYAFIAPEMVEKFEVRLNSYNGVKKYDRQELSLVAGGTLMAYPYVIEAEEGTISPEWELTEKLSWLKRWLILFFEI